MPCCGSGQFRQLRRRPPAELKWTRRPVPTIRLVSLDAGELIGRETTSRCRCLAEQLGEWTPDRVCGPRITSQEGEGGGTAQRQQTKRRNENKKKNLRKKKPCREPSLDVTGERPVLPVGPHCICEAPLKLGRAWQVLATPQSRIEQFVSVFGTLFLLGLVVGRISSHLEPWLSICQGAHGGKEKGCSKSRFGVAIVYHVSAPPPRLLLIGTKSHHP